MYLFKKTRKIMFMILIVSEEVEWGMKLDKAIEFNFFF